MTTTLAPIGPQFRTNVREALCESARRKGLDGVLVLTPANVLYASGFRFSVNERPVGLYVPVSGQPILFVPHLEYENALPTTGVTVKTYEEFPGPQHPIVWMVAESGAKRIAIDSFDARQFAQIKVLTDEILLEDLVAPLRYIKTAEELELIRTAARYADLALERLLKEAGNIISQGGSELDLLADCTGFALKALKADHGLAFSGTELSIGASVHSGPRCALPHGQTSHRKPLKGEPVICGVGASLGGYHAESGATLIVGEPTPEHLRVMSAMQACNDAAISALRPGNLCKDVNTAALNALKDAGLGDTIRHRIGHGMGVEGHEAPWLAPGDRTPIQPFMVFSNEPGVYRPELDGYRTINTMLVFDDHVEIPSRFLTNHSFDHRVITF